MSGEWIVENGKWIVENGKRIVVYLRVEGSPTPAKTPITNHHPPITNHQSPINKKPNKVFRHLSHGREWHQAVRDLLFAAH